MRHFLFERIEDLTMVVAGMRTRRPTSTRTTGTAWSKCAGWSSTLAMKNTPLRDTPSSAPNSRSSITAPPAGRGWDSTCAARQGRRSNRLLHRQDFFPVNHFLFPSRQLGLPLSSLCTVPCNTVFGSQHQMVESFQQTLQAFILEKNNI